MCKTLIPAPAQIFQARVVEVLPGKAVVSAQGVGTVTAKTRGVVFENALVSLVREDRGGWAVA